MNDFIDFANMVRKPYLTKEDIKQLSKDKSQKTQLKKIKGILTSNSKKQIVTKFGADGVATYTLVKKVKKEKKREPVNEEDRKQRDLEYNEKNRLLRNERKRERVACVNCGFLVQKQNKARHLKTKACMEFGT